MAWDEWEQLKEQARSRSQSTQLNGLGPNDFGDGGTDQRLVVNQDDLGAVGHEAFILHEELKKQADISRMGQNSAGDSSTDRAARELKGQHFALGASLAKASSVWGYQLKTLLQACGHISNHLDYTQKMHRNDDEKISADLKVIGDQAAPISFIDSSFK